MNLIDQIKNHPAVWFLGAIVTGFLAGIATYEGALALTGREIISTAEKESAKSNLDDKNAEIQHLNEKLKIADQEVKNKPKQRWLTLTDLQGLRSLRVRIVVKVNGTRFSYPSNVIWAQNNGTMATEKFPLPLSEDGYQLSFELFSLDDNDKFEQHTSTEVILVESFPSDLSYKIFTVTKAQWGANRQPSDVMQSGITRMQFKVE